MSGVSGMTAAVRAAIQQSLTDGLHLAVVSTAVFLVAGAVCVAVLMRRTEAPGRHEARPSDATEWRDTGK